MYEEESPPLTFLGIRIKTILVLLLISVILLVAVNRSEIESLLRRIPIDGQQQSELTEENHIVVDQEMLARAMQEVQVEKLTEIESGDSMEPTDRFFYVVELVSGGDLEGIELTIDPEYVTLISEGGTKTTIERTMVGKIHRFKLPPSTKNEQ